MDQAVHEYDVVDVYEECVPAKADPVDWYKWGRPHRAYRPRTIRYLSAKKVSTVSFSQRGVDYVSILFSAS